MEAKVEKTEEVQSDKFSFELPSSPKEIGPFAHSVLVAVVDRKYEAAIEILKDYYAKKSVLRAYVFKTHKIFEHCEELINAIKAKKTFPNLTSLAPSKQEEIHQKALENWEDLKLCMRRIKTIEKDIASEDAKSSIWVVRATLFAAILITLTVILKEAYLTLGRSFTFFVDDIAKLISGLF